MGLEEDNIKFFRDQADHYDNNPKHKAVHEAVTKAFVEYHTWIGVDWITPEDRASAKREVRLLDYACGTGVVTRRLLPHITHAVGVDITAEMVESFNKQAEAAGLSQTNIYALTGNLLKDPVEPPELMQEAFFNFDIVCIGLGFHHFRDPADAAKQLATRLKPGGVLLLIDLLAEGDAFTGHDAIKSIQTHGFTETDMAKIYSNAGLSDFGFRAMKEPVEIGGKDDSVVRRTIFFSRGVKPVV